MSFKDLYLFEREDENILSKVTPEADRLYKGTVSGLKKLYNKIFFGSKGSEDFSGYDRPFSNFKFDYLKFLQSSKDNSNAFYNHKTKDVSIQKKELLSYLKKVDTIIDALQDIDDSKMVEKFKIEAKISLEKFFEEFKDIKTTIVHELIHKYDDEVNKIFSTKYYDKVATQLDDLAKKYNVNSIDLKVYQKKVDEIRGTLKDYLNLDSEVNAYFLQSIYQFLNTFEGSKDILTKDFQSFKDWFVSKFLRGYYQEWDESNKRKFIKRLYDFYVKFLQKIKEETK